MTTTVASYDKRSDKNRPRWLEWLDQKRSQGAKWLNQKKPQLLGWLDENEPEWLGWLAIGFLALNILLLVTAVFLWQHRQSTGTTAATGSGVTSAVVPPEVEKVTTKGQVTSPAEEKDPPVMPSTSTSGMDPEVPPPAKAEAVTEHGVIAGQISLQGQSSAGITILLDDMPAATTDNQGRFRIADVPAGSHTVKVEHPGYIPREAGMIQVTGEESVTLPAVSLRGGDTDQDGDVDIFDVVRFATNPRGTDVNGDGMVDVRDAIMVDANYGSAGPEPW